MKPRIESTLKVLTRTTITCASLFFFVSAPSIAAQISLAWDANDPPVDGYLLFMRPENSDYDYTTPVWSGVDTTCTIEDISNGAYYFVVRAYSDEAESSDSNEVEAVISDLANTSGNDCDVDGLDLVAYITGDTELGLDALAADFGHVACQ